MDSQEFKITLPITGWVKRSETKDGRTRNWLVIEGFASDSSRDQRGGIFSEGAVLGMIECVNMGKAAPVWKDVARAMANRGESYSGPMMDGDGSVGIDIEHSEHWTDQIGYATEAKAIYDLTPEQKAAGMQAPIMQVKCAINLNMSHGRDLEEALLEGKKLGLSIFGDVVEGWREVTRSGQHTDRFEKVALKRIAVTQQPANKNMWLNEVKRSMEGVKMEERLQEVEQEAAQKTPGEPAEAPNAAAESSEGLTASEIVSQNPSDAAAPTDNEAEPSTTTAEAEGVEAEGSAEVEAQAEIEPVAEAAPAPRLEELLPDGGVSSVQSSASSSVAANPDLAAILPDGGASAASQEGAESAPAPESAVSTAPEPVARVEIGEVEVFRSELSQIRELLSPLRDLVEGVEEYKGEVARTQNDVASLTALVSQLAGEVKALRTASMGRRGFTVARSMGGPVSDVEEAGVLGTELPAGSPERRAMIEKIKRELGPAAAINYMMGNLVDPNKAASPVIGPAPTLSEIEQRMAAEEAKAQDAAPDA